MSLTPSRCTGRMAAPGAESLEFLTRRHGVKIDVTASIEECSLAVSAVVGHENVLSASRMNNAIVLFVKTIELANLLVESGVEIGGIFTSVLPLSTPSKRVTLSNVLPFIKNEVLVGMLSRYGKLVSPIKMILIGSKSSLLKHVVSFRRYVYMVLKDNVEELDLTLNFRHEEFNYVIYATTNTMRCFGCGENGHLIRGCPKREENVNKTALTVASESANEVQNEIATVVEEMPGPSRASVAPKVVEKVSEIVENSEIVGKVGVAAAGEKEGICSQRIEQAVVDSDDGSNSEDEAMVNPEDGDSVLGDEECLFKIPQKRKLLECPAEKKAKRIDGIHMSQTDTESESDISECSVTASLPQSGFSSRTYTVVDIKSFLKITKNVKKVKLEEYFPDIIQFIEKVKIFRSESCFTNQEVYRLKKIITKLSSQSGGPSENSQNG